jgi:dCMP deaminase
MGKLSKMHKYMGVAEEIARRFSKDSSTKVAAMVIGPANEVRSMGYNGAPRGCAADEDIRGATRPEKYFWFSHAELNAITNAARCGTPLDGGTMIVTHMPCMDCARAIVQAGIRRVVTREPDPAFMHRWSDHVIRARQLFEECGVELIFLEPENARPDQ